MGSDGKPAAGTIGTKVIEVAGYKVGFFGLLTPETDVLSSPGPGIDFAPVVETAAAAVKELRAAGADLIVALTHSRPAGLRTRQQPACMRSTRSQAI